MRYQIETDTGSAEEQPISIKIMQLNDGLVVSNFIIQALQNMENRNIHIGGRSALELQRFAHHLQINSYETTLFESSKSKLPLWFTNNNWNT